MMVLYGYYLLFWKNSGAFNTRRAILLAIPLVSIIIPSLSFSPQINTVAIPAFNLDEVVFSGKIADTPTQSWSPLLLLSIIYSLGLLIFSVFWLRSLKGVVGILFVKKNELKKKDGYWIIYTNGKIPTCSFFNLLFWNNESQLGQRESNMVMEHELAHIRHFHSLDVILLSVFKVVFWFHPIIHRIMKEISLVHEYIADEEASRDHSKSEYIQLLANQTLYHMKHQWIQSFNKGPLLKRLEALEKPALIRTKGRMLMLIPVLTVLILTFSCDSNQSSETADESSAKVEEALSQVEEMPQFEGGMDAMVSFLTKNLKYPESARKNGSEGKVFVQFVVEKDGSITNTEVVKGFDEDCDAEALRVVEAMPRWKPGKMDGAVVRTRMTLPIAFALGE
jgi:TonB family protein